MSGGTRADFSEEVTLLLDIRWSQRRRAFQVKRVTYVKDRRSWLFREEGG